MVGGYRCVFVGCVGHVPGVAAEDNDGQVRPFAAENAGIRRPVDDSGRDRVGEELLGGMERRLNEVAIRVRADGVVVLENV